MEATSEVKKANNQENSAEKLSRVIGVVCGAFNIAPKDITNKEDRAFLVPRQVTAYFLKTAGGQTLKTIREALGLVVDGQVYQYCARVKQLGATDAAVREKLEKIRAELGCAPDDSPVMPTVVPANLKPTAPQTEPRKQQEKTERATQKTPTPKKILAAVGNMFCTPELLTHADPAAVIRNARGLAIFILWHDSELPLPEIAALFNMNEEQAYTALGRATVLFKSDEAFAQAVSSVRANL